MHYDCRQIYDFQFSLSTESKYLLENKAVNALVPNKLQARGIFLFYWSCVSDVLNSFYFYCDSNQIKIGNILSAIDRIMMFIYPFCSASLFSWHAQVGLYKLNKYFYTNHFLSLTLVATHQFTHSMSFEWNSWLVSKYLFCFLYEVNLKWRIMKEDERK